MAVDNEIRNPMTDLDTNVDLSGLFGDVVDVRTDIDGVIVAERKRK